ncbi:hypothetical protein [Sphingomonas crusticola]|uniref:hypothetical protein n=1 Tax=Sphingomonas crusticola TaxID=1697973 RepID=UPI0013C2F87A|nr:hypothetical protein [Sphingomonas crusticola]
MSSDAYAGKRRDEAQEHRVVAVGLLTEHDLSVLGQGFRRIYRIDDGHNFHQLLAAIDAAERDLHP